MELMGGRLDIYAYRCWICEHSKSKSGPRAIGEIRVVAARRDFFTKLPVVRDVEFRCMAKMYCPSHDTKSPLRF